MLYDTIFFIIGYRNGKAGAGLRKEEIRSSEHGKADKEKPGNERMKGGKQDD